MRRRFRNQLIIYDNADSALKKKKKLCNGETGTLDNLLG